MKKLVYLLIAVSLMLALVPAAAYAHTEGNPFSTDLMAGQHMDVGDVLVWNDADTLYIKYVITDSAWCITETHLQVATDLGDIPQKKGNPIPGKFEENDEHDCVSGVEYTYNLTERGWDVNEELYIAAHAVVQKGVGYEDPNLDNFAAALPAQVTMSVVEHYVGGPSYFPQTTLSGGTVLDGTYEGWCADTDHVIYPNTNYTANVYSSYETLPAGLVEYPENLDLVNWIINQGFVGQPSSGCSGNYTCGDVQRAIWVLIEDNLTTIGLWPWSQCRADEILAAAYVNGEGFVPGCDDYVAVILQPVDPNVQVITIAQVTFASVGVPCEPIFQYETAWGAGSDFPGKNWATYFTYTVQEPCTNVPEVVNGDFESPVVTHEKGWNIFTPDQVGWTVEWAGDYTGAPEDAYLELHRDVNDWTPYDGQYAELDTDWQGPGSAGGEEASVRIYQDLETCPGEEYTLTFAYSPRPGEADNVLEVYWDNSLKGTYSANGSGNSDTVWTEVTLDVTASGLTTRLEFVEAGTPDSLGMFLDAVSVQKK